MLKWLKGRLRGMSPATERRLLIALARAEEEIVRTHVQNAVDVIRAVAGDMSLARALELYLDELDVDEPQATIIAQRVLSRLEEEEEEER
jgi:hypothetical protein